MAFTISAGMRAQCVHTGDGLVLVPCAVVAMGCLYAASRASFLRTTAVVTSGGLTLRRRLLGVGWTRSITDTPATVLEVKTATLDGGLSFHFQINQEGRWITFGSIMRSATEAAAACAQMQRRFGTTIPQPPAAEPDEAPAATPDA
jgi:hypothetical protein